MSSEGGRGGEGRGGEGILLKLVEGLTLDKNQPIKISVCSLQTLPNVHYYVSTLNIFNSKFI